MYELSYRNKDNTIITIRSEGIGALREKTRGITKPWEIYEIKQSAMNPIKGVKCHHRIVTKIDAMKIRESFLRGKTVAELARRNKLAYTTIQRVLNTVE